MTEIPVIQGTRFTPDALIARMSRNKKLRHIRCKPVTVLYSTCWIFAFHIDFAVSKKHVRHAGWYGGVDEQTAAPGVVQRMPETAPVEARDFQILPGKLTREQAEELAWQYNLRWIKKKHRMLFAPPVRADVEVHKYYKPVYLLEFYNEALDQTLYKAMDSLTGDMETVKTEGDEKENAS